MPHDNSSAIVSRVWNYAHVLKNVGVGYGDCIEQHRIVTEAEARGTAIVHLEAGLDCQITRSSRLRRTVPGGAFRGC